MSSILYPSVHHPLMVGQTDSVLFLFLFLSITILFYKHVYIQCSSRNKAGSAHGTQPRNGWTEVGLERFNKLYMEVDRERKAFKKTFNKTVQKTIRLFCARTANTGVVQGSTAEPKGPVVIPKNDLADLSDDECEIDNESGDNSDNSNGFI